MVTWDGCLTAPVTSTVPCGGTSRVGLGVAAAPVVGALVVDPPPNTGANARITTTARGIHRRYVTVRDLDMDYSVFSADAHPVNSAGVPSGSADLMIQRIPFPPETITAADHRRALA